MKLHYKPLNVLLQQGSIQIKKDSLFGEVLIFYCSNGLPYRKTKATREKLDGFGKPVVIVRDTANPFSLGYIFNFSRLPVVDDWAVEVHPELFEMR